MATRKTNDEIPLDEVDPETDHRSWRYSWEKPWKKGLNVCSVPKMSTEKVFTMKEAMAVLIADQQQLQNRAQRKKPKNVHKT